MDVPSSGCSHGSQTRAKESALEEPVVAEGEYTCTRMMRILSWATQYGSLFFVRKVGLPCRLFDLTEVHGYVPQ